MMEVWRLRLLRPLPLAALASCVIAVSACGASQATSPTAGGTTPPAPVAPLNIVIPTVNPQFSEPYVAYVLGYFTDAGVQVKITDGVGGNMLPLVVSGQEDLAWSGTGQSLPPVLQGKATSIVWNYAGGGAGGYMVARSGIGIKSPADCAGRRVVTLGGGGSTQGHSFYYQKKLGVQWSVVQVASFNLVQADLASASADCAVGAKSWFEPGLANGSLITLIDPAKKADSQKYEGAFFSESSVYGMTANLKTKRESVVRFLSAVKRADTYLHTASVSQVVSDLLKYPSFAGQSSASLTQSFKDFIPLMDPNKGFISSEEWQRTLQRLAFFSIQGFSPDDPALSYAKVVDMSYWKGSK